MNTYSYNLKNILSLLIVQALFLSCSSGTSEKTASVQPEAVLQETIRFNVDEQLKECENQLEKSYAKITDVNYHPVDIAPGETSWRLSRNSMGSWVQGFYPGTLWYMYEVTGDPHWKEAAEKSTNALDTFKYNTKHHDIGFVMYSSFGNGYRLSGQPAYYKDVLLESAASAIKRYRPETGTIQSWNVGSRSRWSQHPTIIDNMMNLELLFWAARNGGDKKYYDIALKHAETTMENHFRPDYSSYHVVSYDTITGEPLMKVTKQGANDSSMWARGQAWAIYGFTMTYRDTKDPRFLDFAQKITDRYIRDLPEDKVPYWDFDAPNIPDEERDASAAAIVASALLELQQYVTDEQKRETYLKTASQILNSLSSDSYFAKGKADSFLLHGVGHKPGNSQVNVALSYADYYYLESLIRLKKLIDEEELYPGKDNLATII
jgi:unsaturated chondroitin disaccharide hydrolase